MSFESPSSPTVVPSDTDFQTPPFQRTLSCHDAPEKERKAPKREGTPIYPDSSKAARTLSFKVQELSPEEKQKILLEELKKGIMVVQKDVDNAISEVDPYCYKSAVEIKVSKEGFRKALAKLPHEGVKVNGLEVIKSAEESALTLFEVNTKLIETKKIMEALIQNTFPEEKQPPSDQCKNITRYTEFSDICCPVFRDTPIEDVEQKACNLEDDLFRTAIVVAPLCKRTSNWLRANIENIKRDMNDQLDDVTNLLLQELFVVLEETAFKLASIESQVAKAKQDMVKCLVEIHRVMML